MGDYGCCNASCATPTGDDLYNCEVTYYYDCAETLYSMVKTKSPLNEECFGDCPASGECGGIGVDGFWAMAMITLGSILLCICVCMRLNCI